MSEITTVKLRRATKEKLAKLGNKDESYDAIIQRVLEFYLRNATKRKKW